MELNLHWKRGIFKSSYEIFSGELSVGNLRPDSWSNRGAGDLNNKKYRFESKGFFNHETQIIDSDLSREIGKITYNSWKTRATIELENKTLFWKYDNTWNTKWSIYNQNDNILRYQGSFTKGEITIYNYDEILILTGLYISNYFWQMSSVVIITTLMPIYISLLF